MKRKLKIVAITILVIAIISSGAVYLFRKQIVAHYIPAVELVGGIHIDVNSDTLLVRSSISVRNKSFLKITIDSIHYKVSLFGNTYLQKRQFAGVSLGAYGKDTLAVSLKIPYRSIIKDLKAERNKGDSTSYSVSIALLYSTVLGKLEIPVEKTDKIKLPQPPDIEVVEIKYSKIRLKSILAEAKIKITNYSDFTLSIKEMHYSMNIIKQGMLKGNYSETIDIRPKESTLITLPIQITPKNLGKTIFQVIMNRDNYDYTLSLNATLEMTNPFKQSFHIDISKSGKMELRK